MVSCGRCSVSHTLHDTAFLPGNLIAGTDEHISAPESPLVLATHLNTSSTGASGSCSDSTLEILNLAVPCFLVSIRTPLM